MDDRPEKSASAGQELGSDHTSERDGAGGSEPRRILGGLLMGELPPFDKNASGLGFRALNPLPLPPTFSTAKLAEFARKRGMPVGFPGWEDAVLYQAAIEHPELSWTTRGRGRPKSQPRGGLLSVTSLPSETEGDAVLKSIERIKDYVASVWDQELSDKDACRYYVEFKDKLDPSNPAHAERFASKLQHRQNQVSKARKRQGKPLR